MMLFKKNIVSVLIILYACNTCASLINLHRIFHHIGTNMQQNQPAPNLELAQLVFYFDQEPTINKGKKETVNDVEKIELFFPGSQLKGLKAEDLLKELKSVDGTVCYTAKCEQTAVGVKCTIAFNKKQVVFDYDTFLSISSQHAVRLHFFNKLLLDKMNRSNSLLQVASITKPRVVLDCGHGGRDAGALGLAGVYEKDITLALGKEVAKLLQNKGFEVYMTRNADVYLPLDVRTSLANAMGARALVSIHANACTNKTTSGIETFCLSPTLFNVEKNHKNKYNDITQHYYCQLFDAGQQLAHLVHAHVIDAAYTVYSVCNRKVKTAAAQVLLGSQIPAALIEIGFLSNDQEAALLTDIRYQQLLAQGISNGIVAYCNSSSKMLGSVDFLT